MPEIKLCHEIKEIGKEAWNQLCKTDYPFARYEFLYALETSGSVQPKTGWQPLHLLLQDNGINIGVMPLYLKNHSYGEYVFDWAWADAYNRYGLEYYPKLVTAIPFSPVTGPRLLTQQDPKPLLEMISHSLPQIAEQVQANSWHLLFPTDEERNAVQHPHLMHRKGCQYQWFNKNYADFDDFLATFTSRKRKNVRKERQKVIDHGITHVQLDGEDISPEQLDQFYDFYRMTYLKRGREAYLTKEFFFLLKELMPENLLLVLAYNGDQPVAGALSLKDSTTLYGRYWGCFDEYDSLHFETCYYQGIDYCIANKLRRFDSGAQGEHKIQRGFEPVETWSAHWVKEVGFNQAIQQFVDEESEAIDQQIEHLKQYLPFRNNEN
ncbi:GNAT family N-acetyltransferase [Neptuniibacter sp.]|uniref:GNAT family N-acetyltransferase n=1 Tax=Neptuniibacter sp. TaxID=1962643 RepID=UPI0026327C7F|nr:GNAT family N-acetyltransferase [Neptuniibacter sp.]MCP4596805.1 N-acetyltransferase [Neptuniibacter sp.]